MLIHFHSNSKVQTELNLIVESTGLKWKYVTDKWVTARQLQWVKPTARKIKSFYERHWKNTNIDSSTPPRPVPTRGDQLDDFEN